MADSELTMIGNDFTFQVGDGASPETFSDFCAVFDVGALGEDKPLIDVTSLCDTARKYRNGLADGLEIPLKVNFIQGDVATRNLYAKYNANAIVNFRVKLNGTSPEEYFEFAATVRAWNIALAVGAKTEATFTLKITGPVAWHHA